MDMNIWAVIMIGLALFVVCMFTSAVLIREMKKVDEAVKPKRKKYKKRKPTPMSPEVQRVLQLLPAMNDSAIAREVSLSREYIRQLRVKYSGEKSQYHNQWCSSSWTEDKLAKLYTLDQSEHTIEEAAKIVGVSKAVLQCQKTKLGLGRWKNSMIKYELEPMMELYRKHDGNFTRVAEELGVPQSGIARWFLDRGIHGQGLRFGGPELRTKYTKELLDPLWEKNDGNVCAIARELGVNHAGIYVACKRLGYPIRKNKVFTLTEKEMSLLYIEHRGNMVAIAKATDYSQNTIYQRFRKAGYPALGSRKKIWRR